jgi:hypothetical protein
MCFIAHHELYVHMAQIKEFTIIHELEKDVRVHMALYKMSSIIQTNHELASSLSMYITSLFHRCS